MFAPRAGLIAITMVQPGYTDEQMERLFNTMYGGDLGLRARGLLTLTAACQCNLVTDPSCLGSEAVFVVGDCRAIFVQVLRLDILPLLQDAQNGPAHPAGGAVYLDSDLSYNLQEGTLTSQPLPSTVGPGSKPNWRTVGPLIDGKRCSLSVLLAACLCGVFTAHRSRPRRTRAGPTPSGSPGAAASPAPAKPPPSLPSCPSTATSCWGPRTRRCRWQQQRRRDATHNTRQARGRRPNSGGARPHAATHAGRAGPAGRQGLEPGHAHSSHGAAAAVGARVTGPGAGGGGRGAGGRRSRAAAVERGQGVCRQ